MILIIIAKNDFKDEEFIIPFEKFKKAKLEIEIASTEKGDCISTTGRRVLANFSFYDIHTSNTTYDAIVLIGGSGSKILVGNKDLEKVLKTHKGLFAAICFAPVILAKARILEGKKATVWDEDKKQSPLLEEYGAIYTSNDIEIDDNIITANGFLAAEKFAEAIISFVKTI